MFPAPATPFRYRLQRVSQQGGTPRDEGRGLERLVCGFSLRSADGHPAVAQKDILLALSENKRAADTWAGATKTEGSEGL